MMAVLSELSEGGDGRPGGPAPRTRPWQGSLESSSGGTRELRRSNEHLAAFAGQVSHDLQGPLAAVLMSLQLMEEEAGGPAPEQRDSCSCAARSPVPSGCGRRSPG